MREWTTEFKQTLLLAFPMVLSQLSQHLIQVIDSAMIGRVGVVELAAAALATNVFFLPLVFCFGISVATTILVSSAFGAGDLNRANHSLRLGLLLCTLFGLVFASLLHFGAFALGWMGQPEDVVEAAKPYFVLLAWSIVPALWFSCLKNYAEAMNRPWMPLQIMLVMLFTNVFLNWVLIFGNLGMPALGLVGAGWATLISRFFSVLLICLYLEWDSSWSFEFRTTDWFRVKLAEIREFLGIGIPSALQIVTEVSAFVLAAIMMGWLGEVTLAAHQIVANVAGTTFMVVLGVSFAISVRASQFYGRKDFVSLRRVGVVGWWMNVSFMSTCMLLLILFRGVIPTWFVLDAEVIALASTLLIVAGLFQVFDGVQVVMISGLRGMRDVRTPTLLILFVYYGICLPLAYYLGFVRDEGGLGVWLGLAAGLALSAVVLSLRFHQQSMKLVRLSSAA